MKAFDIYALWKSFDELMDSNDFTNEDKLAIGKEMLVSLPPGPLCTQVPQTHFIVTVRMEERLKKLEGNGRAEEAVLLVQDQPTKAASKGTKGPRKEHSAAS